MSSTSSTTSTNSSIQVITPAIKSHTTTVPRSIRWSNRTYLPLQTASHLATRLFNPNLRRPRGLRAPTVPSLRASQLPPPCAELDERPKSRLRRFVIWKDKVPPLRLIVLDPKKRVHLRRFNAFQIPSTTHPIRGIRTTPGDLRTFRNRPTPSRASNPAPSPPRLERVPTERPVRTMSSTGVVPAQAGGVIAPPVTTPLTPATPTPGPLVVGSPGDFGRRKYRVRSTPESRRADRARLLQHQFVLEQQAEKRWRMAMAYMVSKMLLFQEQNTMPTLTAMKPIWTPAPDVATIMQWIGFMSDIRKWGNVWPHLELAQRDLPEHEKIKPVRGLSEARMKVKEANRRREELKRAKNAKIKAIKEAKAAAMASSGDIPTGTERMAFIGPLPRGVGPSMVLPRKVSSVPRPASPTSRPLSSRSPSSSISQARNQPHDSPESIPGSDIRPKRDSSCDSSHSEHLITPPTSDIESKPVQPEPKNIEGPVTATTLRSLGLEPGIPDEIARKLAEMLTQFQTIRLERAGRDRDMNERESASTTPRSVSPRTGRRDRRRHGAGHGHQGLSISIDADVRSDLTDTTEDSSNGEEETHSWITGELNMDEDTKAVLSGAGTDVGSAP